MATRDDRTEGYSAGEEGELEFVNDDEESDEQLEDEILQADGYREAGRFGTTAAEERRGEPLSQRLSEEEPDVLDLDRDATDARRGNRLGPESAAVHPIDDDE
ncbi:MAG TPA: hypothetical protein VE172_05170 [Stackebrandtia sp.]|uniref:hypothetical protein n=1 Tax=Stackebrandtia sp. TaxID=2023065 RepID=UPI002D55BA89|nr:hypothetical protein [Stackebrandtia sp.]HZE38185.1 hypothetical protein [Stackebrandtia sp.]